MVDGDSKRLGVLAIVGHLFARAPMGPGVPAAAIGVNSYIRLRNENWQSDAKLQFVYPIKLGYFLCFRRAIQVSGCTQACHVAYLKYRVAVRGNWLAGGELVDPE